MVELLGVAGGRKGSVDGGRRCGGGSERRRWEVVGHWRRGGLRGEDLERVRLGRRAALWWGVHGGR